MLNARSVYRRVAILHSLQSERPITIKIHVRNSSSSQCKILPRVPHAESSFPGLTLDSFLVPATPEPLITCVIAGSAQFRERDIGAAWLKRQLRRGGLFLLRSKT